MTKMNDLMRTVRESLGVMQMTIAEEADLSPTALQRFEIGKLTLSNTTVQRIAAAIHLNPDYVSGEAASPFKNSEFYKFFVLEERAASGGIRPITDLILFCKELSIASLTIDRAIDSSYRLFAQTPEAEPVYAVAIRDNANNMFLIRRRKPDRLILLEGRDQSRVMQFFMPAHGKEDTKVSFGKVKLDNELYGKIKDWKVSHQDINNVFDAAVFTELVSPTEKEIQLLVALRRGTGIDQQLINFKTNLLSPILNDILRLVKDESADLEKRKDVLKSLVSFYIARMKGIMDPNVYVQELKVLFDKFELPLLESDVKELSSFLSDDVLKLIIEREDK
jgi:transcriptional regulator with XRE-family HTH domain